MTIMIKPKNVEEVYEKLSGPLMVAWDITNRCNMCCRHCFNDSKQSNSSDDELGIQHINKLKIYQFMHI